MQITRSFKSEIKTRGQLTIPKKLRDTLNLEEGQEVSIIPVGDSFVVTPRRLELDEARRQIRQILKRSSCSIQEVMEGLQEERASLYSELYGKKND
ncbi:MAG: AbrB/MazE/SpoVT family DNA-binding domain-containing protein [Deltaproteobacteria bacterium]|nr:AbrB/MazE/SpoVT family DNA-binding domain-containing protein [Deltaproteobacteria bacterium]